MTAPAADLRNTPIRIVFVHGFTQTGRSWTPLLEPLRTELDATGRAPECLTPDAPGHGQGGPPTDLSTGAERIAAVGGRANYVGYSMGGRLCLHLALARPDLVESLVLIGAHPGLEDPNERAARIRSDNAWAEDLERDGLDVFLQRWLAQPLFARLPADRADLEARRANTVAGLAGSIRQSGTGRQSPLWDQLASVRCPVLVLAGEHDHRYITIGERAAALLTDGTFEIVPDAGHAAHLEQPNRTASIIASWYSQRDASS